MKNQVSRGLCLLAAAVTLGACTAKKSQDGTIEFALNAEGPDGLYELCAAFEVMGPVERFFDSRPSAGGGLCMLMPASLPAGPYEVRIREDWALRRVGTATMLADAELIFGDTRLIEIQPGRTTVVAFRFRVNGVDLEVPEPRDGGVLDIGIDVEPRPDGGAPDGGMPDAGPAPDGGTPDAGPAPEPAVCEALPTACNPSWYADGECDPVNNSAECTWDEGDCCESTCTNADCGGYAFDCRDPSAGGDNGEPPALGAPCAEVPNPFDPTRMLEEVTLLSSDELLGRDPGFSTDLRVRRYIRERFRCMGLTPLANGCYQQAFANADDFDPTANVIGIIEGGDSSVSDEIIVIGGHHDHLGASGGVVYNGANDNASGIVGMLAIAQSIQNSGARPRRTIAFVAFGSEESGLEGANYYVTNPPNELPMDDVVYMINLDMLGTYDQTGRVDAFGTHAGTPGRAILDEVLTAHADLNVRLGLTAPVEDSDYDPFCVVGIPHVYFETPDPTCLHEACDDAGRIDAPHMAELATILGEVAVGLASTETDLAAARQTLGCMR